MPLKVTLQWNWLFRDGDPRWQYNRALYAYLHPEESELLYIGKADGCTVRERWLQKQAFWRDLEKQCGIHIHRIIVAEINTDERLSRELLCDIESLLIFELRPWGNIQCTSSRGISRPGMKVVCEGPGWPLARRIFHDC